MVLDAGWEDVVAALASALGGGLLMGIERERSVGGQRALAGVRSFPLVALAGAVAALWGGPWLVGSGALFVAALGVVAYARDRSPDAGVTTEIALWLAFAIGVVSASHPAQAAALAVVVTGLLAAREALHRFALDWLRPAEVQGALILAAIALLVLPLAPSRPLWGDVLNPQVMVRLVLVLLLIQSFAHLGRRLLSAQHALALAALASGFVSSTATIASLGVAVREGREAVRPQAGAAVLSCVATMVQILLVAATVQPTWLGVLWGPALAGALVAVLWGWALLRVSLKGSAVVEHAADTAMFRLRDALLIAVLLTAIQVLVHALALWLGDAGLIGGTLLAALADLHAAVAAVMVQGRPADAMGATLVWAFVVAVSVHALSKTGVAWASGGGRYALAVGGGVILHTLAFVALLLG